MPITIRDVLRDAAIEIGALAQGENLQAAEQSYMLGRLNRMLDAWNAVRETIYADQGVRFTLVPDLSPHTIGVGGVWPLASGRPVSIESAMLILPTSTPMAYEPIQLHDAQWWYAWQQTPTLPTQYPTDLYYEPAWPLGRLHFWPTPTAAWDVQLQIRRALAEVVLDDVFTLPPGYLDAITYSLAEAAAKPMGLTLPPALAQQAATARHRIFVNNVTVPRIATQDSGMPSGPDSANLPTWDYLTGS